MSEQRRFFSHETLERNVGWLIITTIVVISIAGLVQIVPLFFQHSTTEPSPGVVPYSALRLAGRDIYQREGCLGCHCRESFEKLNARPPISINTAHSCKENFAFQESDIQVASIGPKIPVELMTEVSMANAVRNFDCSTAIFHKGLTDKLIGGAEIPSKRATKRI